MKRSASRSRRMEGRDLFRQPRVAIRPRLVVRTDDGELTSSSTRSSRHWIGRVRPRPARLDRLPLVLHAALAAWRERPRPTAAADRPRARESRGRAAAARRRAPGRGRRRTAPTATRRSATLREAIAERYRTCTASTWITNTEVAVVPRTKTALVELAVALAERESTVLLPDPGYPTIPPEWRWQRRSSSRSARPAAGWAPAWAEALARTSRPVPQLPSNRCAAAAPPGVFRRVHASPTRRAPRSSTTSTAI